MPSSPSAEPADLLSPIALQVAANYCRQSRHNISQDGVSQSLARCPLGPVQLRLVSGGACSRQRSNRDPQEADECKFSVHHLWRGLPERRQLLHQLQLERELHPRFQVRRLQ